MPSQREANDFGEAVWGAAVATLIVVGVVSKFWPYFLGAVIVLGLGVWWWRARRRRRARQGEVSACSYPAAPAPRDTPPQAPATMEAAAPSSTALKACTCDGPSHPFSSAWCAPSAAAVTSPSRSSSEAITDAEEWARRLDSDAARAEPWTRAKLSRQAQLLRYLAHPTR